MKFISQENTASPAAADADVLSGERIVAGSIVPFKIAFLAFANYVIGKIVFPSQVLSGSAVTHTIGTAFQASATKVVNGSYAVAINVQSLLLGTAEERVDLFIGATSGSQTLLADTAAVKTAGVLNLNNTQTVTLKAKLPIGWYAKLVATSVSGTANSATWVSGYEQTEG